MPDAPRTLVARKPGRPILTIFLTSVERRASIAAGAISAFLGSRRNHPYFPAVSEEGTHGGCRTRHVLGLLRSALLQVVLVLLALRVREVAALVRVQRQAQTAFVRAQVVLRWAGERARGRGRTGAGAGARAGASARARASASKGGWMSMCARALDRRRVYARVGCAP